MSWFTQNAPAAGDPTTGQGINERGPVAPEQSGNPMDAQALIQQFMQGKPSGPATMQALVQFLAQNGHPGWTVPPRGDGVTPSSDKLIAPNQAVYDFLHDEGGANRFQMVQDGYFVDGRPSSTPGTWSDPNRGEGPMGGMLPPGFSLDPSSRVAPFTAPGLLAPYTDELTFDPAKISENPAYQFRLKEGMNDVLQHKSAQGLLKTGGALTDLMEFGQGLASTFMNDDFNRELGMKNFNRGTFWGNQDNTFGRLNMMSNTGLSAANTASGVYGSMGDTAAAGAMGRGNNTQGLLGPLADIANTGYQEYLKRRQTNAGA